MNALNFYAYQTVYNLFFHRRDTYILSILFTLYRDTELHEYLRSSVEVTKNTHYLANK
jgi:hypothetical protein